MAQLITCAVPVLPYSYDGEVIRNKGRVLWSISILKSQLNLKRLFVFLKNMY
jgi:hypothetical protein